MTHPIEPAEFAARIVRFYRRRRRALPWRETRDPYAIWVSEIMLQQTRVETVIPYYRRWLERFPTVADLAAAPIDDVLASWSGLGYYSRARNLHRGAAEVIARYGGELPDTAAALRTLPGIGRYTAGAIASLAHGLAEPVVDGNVARVLARVYAIDEDIKSTAGQRRLWKLAGELVSREAPGDYNQGLMELGATVCKPRAPACDECPVTDVCRARAGDRVAELPVVAPRKRDADKPLIELDAIWLRAGDHVLLARRAPGGLFGGLWELPAATGIEALLAGLPGARTTGAAPDVVHRQVLSHRRLEIRAWRGAGSPSTTIDEVTPWPPYAELRWQPLASLPRLGLSSGTDAIVNELKEP